MGATRYEFDEDDVTKSNCSKTVYVLSHKNVGQKNNEKDRFQSGDPDFPYSNNHNDVKYSIKNVTKSKTKTLNTKKISVFLSSFLSVTVCAGIVFNMSVLNNEWMDYFQKTKAETSLVQSIAIGLVGVGGLPSGLAVAKFGPMKVGIAAGCILLLGLCLSYFATDVFFLVFTTGIIAGTGFSLAFNSAFSSISQHFEGRQATLVLAFLSFGSGVGGMCTPTLLQVLIDMYGWRGTMLILGGITLNISAFAITYRNTVVCKTTTPLKKKSCVDVMKSLISNGLFVCFVIAIAMISVLNTVLVFLVDYLESCGMTRKEAIDIYFWMTVTSTISRLTPGILKLMPRVSTMSLPVAYTALACISLALLPYYKTKIPFTIVACCFGASWGGMISVNTIVVLKLVQREQFSTAFGIRGAAIGLAGIVAVPISGHLRDISGDYCLTFYSSSATMAVSCILFTGIFIYRSSFKTKNKKTDQL